LLKQQDIPGAGAQLERTQRDYPKCAVAAKITKKIADAVLMAAG
jgi:hypothetical protein